MNQQTKDAICDAETLQIAVAEHGPVSFDGVGMAEVYGGRDAVSEIQRGNRTNAARFARWAAHAAFRAVPGLRA